MTPDAYPAVGSFVAGRYRIDALLGEGGMGAVFAASDANGARYALKFPAPEIRSRQGMMSRFANEAVAASRIASEHVVRIAGVEATEQGVPFMVMELLEGTDLDQIIERDAPVDIPRAVHFALQILRALQVAHAAGVVHRDLKPSNCFVVRTPEDPEFIKLIDFGIIKILGDDAQNLTQTSITMGTPAYMAPEQAKSAKAAEPRSDLYAVGVILYELVTRKRPFEGDSHNELVVKICTEPPLPIRDVRPDLPPGLASAIERALVKAPSGRFASAAVFADALKPFSDARSRAVLELIESNVGTAPPPHVVVPGGGALGPTAMGPTEPGESNPPDRQPQKTVIAEGPIVFADQAAPAPNPAGPIAPAAIAPVMPASAAPAVIPSGGEYSAPERRSGGNGALLAVLGVLAVALIGVGVYYGAFYQSSPTPSPTPAATPTTSDDDNGTDDEGKPKKKKKKEDGDQAEAPTDTAPEPGVPPPATGATTSKTAKPKPSTSTSASALPSTKPSTTATTPPSGTTTAPTIILPPGWVFPTTSAPPPATTTPPPPPATTTAPPATTTPPKPTTTVPTIFLPPGGATAKKPKIGGS